MLHEDEASIVRVHEEPPLPSCMRMKTPDGGNQNDAVVI